MERESTARILALARIIKVLRETVYLSYERVFCRLFIRNNLTLRVISAAGSTPRLHSFIVL